MNVGPERNTVDTRQSTSKPLPPITADEQDIGVRLGTAICGLAERTPRVEAKALRQRLRALPVHDRLRLAERFLEFDPDLAATIADDVIAQLRAAKTLTRLRGGRE